MRDDSRSKSAANRIFEQPDSHLGPSDGADCHNEVAGAFAHEGFQNFVRPANGDAEDVRGAIIRVRIDDCDRLETTLELHGLDDDKGVTTAKVTQSRVIAGGDVALRADNNTGVVASAIRSSAA